MRNTRLLTTVAASAIATLAHAQQTSPQSGAPVAASGQTLTEIIVTAERRSQSLQRVPLAVTALSAEALANGGVHEPKDLAALVPGLAISTGNGPVDQIYVRGVGTSVQNLFGDNAVSFNVDGVVIARATGLANQLYDLARVEVLEGPQGTLYGRNSTGGAINVITNKPSLSGTSGALSIEGGNYSLVDADGYVNLPVSDTLAFRASGKVINRDGYFSDGYEDDKSYAARVRGLYAPNDRFSVLLNADYSRTDDKGPGEALSPLLNSADPWQGASSPAEQAQFKVLAGHLPLSPPQDNGFNKSDNIGVSAEVNWTVGPGTLTVIPAYRSLHDSFIDYIPGFLNNYSEAANQESFEARYATDDNKPLSFIVGTFLFHENRIANQYVNQNVTSSDTLIKSYPTDAYAGFGQAKYKITSKLHLTAGVRYTNESKSLNAQSTAPATGVVTPYLGDESYKNVSWKVGLDYQMTSRVLVYANVATGFKAGGFFSSPSPYNTFRPETITAYTVGAKSTLFDGRLRLNAEAFYWDYKNHQESHLAISPTGAIVYATQNVGAATMKGVEAEGLLSLWRLAQVTTRAQYLDATFGTFSFAEASPTGAPITGCGVTLISKGDYEVDCNGKPAIRSPRWSGNVDFQQGFDVPGGARLTGHANVEMASGQWEAIDYAPGEYQSGYAIFDLSLDYKPSPESRWSLTGWVRNVGDKALITFANQQIFAPKIVLVDLAPPRTYGVRLNVKF